jgi:hypothetical protein
MCPARAFTGVGVDEEAAPLSTPPVLSTSLAPAGGPGPGQTRGLAGATAPNAAQSDAQEKIFLLCFSGRAPPPSTCHWGWRWRKRPCAELRLSDFIMFEVMVILNRFLIDDFKIDDLDLII